MKPTAEQEKAPPTHAGCPVSHAGQDCAGGRPSSFSEVAPVAGEVRLPSEIRRSPATADQFDLWYTAWIKGVFAGLKVA